MRFGGWRRRYFASLYRDCVEERTDLNDNRRLCSGQPSNMNDINPLMLVAIFAIAAFINGVAATVPSSNTTTHMAAPAQRAPQEQKIADPAFAARYPGVKTIPLNNLPAGNAPPMMPGPVLKESSRKLNNKGRGKGNQPVVKKHDFSHLPLRGDMPKRPDFDAADYLPPHKVQQGKDTSPQSPPNPLSIPQDAKGVHEIPKGSVPDSNEWKFYPPSQANEFHGGKKATLPLLHLKQLPPGSESWKKMQEEEHPKRVPPARPIAPLDWVKLGKIIKEMNEGTQQVQQHIKELTTELKNIEARKKKANDKEGTLLQEEEDRLKGKLTMFKKVLYERQKKERVVQQALRKDQKRSSDDVQGLVYVNNQASTAKSAKVVQSSRQQHV